MRFFASSGPGARRRRALAPLLPALAAALMGCGGAQAELAARHGASVELALDAGRARVEVIDPGEVSPMRAADAAEQHAAFFILNDAEAVAAAARGLAPGAERPVLDRFRDTAAPWRLGERDVDCPENARCIQQAPQVQILLGAPGWAAGPVLLTGEASVESRRENGTDAYSASEPLRDPRWTARLACAPELVAHVSLDGDGGSPSLDAAARARMFDGLSDRLSKALEGCRG